MVVSRGHLFPIELSEAFPQGLVMMGEITPGNEHQSREECLPRMVGSGESKYLSYAFRRQPSSVLLVARESSKAA